MGTIGVIGASSAVEGFALAGVRVWPAVTPDEVRAAWTELKALSGDVAMVILTPAAARALGDEADAAGGPRLTVVMPE
jgi:vacuolar-type H+-ATPase subunit F/Vma7